LFRSQASNNDDRALACLRQGGEHLREVVATVTRLLIGEETKREGVGSERSEETR
jgi:hypothetical protein